MKNGCMDWSSAFFLNYYAAHSRSLLVWYYTSVLHVIVQINSCAVSAYYYIIPLPNEGQIFTGCIISCKQRSKVSITGPLYGESANWQWILGIKDQWYRRLLFCVSLNRLLIISRVVSEMRCLHVHDDVIKWKRFPCYWPFVRGIHRSLVNSPHKGQWHWALMFSLICAWINGWVNNREAGDLRRHRAHYDLTIMLMWCRMWRHYVYWPQMLGILRSSCVDI